MCCCLDVPYHEFETRRGKNKHLLPQICIFNVTEKLCIHKECLCVCIIHKLTWVVSELTSSCKNITPVYNNKFF